MWKIVSLVDDGWNESEPVANLAAARELNATTDNTSIILPVSTDEEMDFHRLAELVLTENAGVVLRVANGITVSSVPGVESGCSGKCYCVHGPDYRRCEAYYCDGNGVCYIVGCPGSC